MGEEGDEEHFAVHSRQFWKHAGREEKTEGGPFSPFSFGGLLGFLRLIDLHFQRGERYRKKQKENSRVEHVIITST